MKASRAPRKPYGSVEESLSEPNDHASGYEAGIAGENNDNSKSLDWQRGWADSHRYRGTRTLNVRCICNQFRDETIHRLAQLGIDLVCNRHHTNQQHPEIDSCEILLQRIKDADLQHPGLLH
jgi:hypothetical protein